MSTKGLYGEDCEAIMRANDERSRYNDEIASLKRLHNQEVAEVRSWIDKYNKVVEDYKVLGDAYDELDVAYDEVKAMKDEAWNVIKENLDKFDIPREELAARINAAKDAVKNSSATSAE